MTAAFQIDSYGERHVMKLGPALGWSPWAPRSPMVWPRERPWRENQSRQYWDAVRRPYFRFHERVAFKRRYRSGPHPWRPGRYTTAKWLPYSGFGRFSNLRYIMDRHYYAARYTGEHVTPLHYVLHHSGREAYDAALASDRRRLSWRMAA